MGGGSALPPQNESKSIPLHLHASYVAPYGYASLGTSVRSIQKLERAGEMGRTSAMSSAQPHTLPPLGSGTQVPVRQSAPTRHACPTSQRAAQPPPQSIAVSRPFFTPSIR